VSVYLSLAAHTTESTSDYVTANADAALIIDGPTRHVSDGARAVRFVLQRIYANTSGMGDPKFHALTSNIPLIRRDFARVYPAPTTPRVTAGGAFNSVRVFGSRGWFGYFDSARDAGRFASRLKRRDTR